MTELYKQLLQQLKRGNSAALVTVLESSGSTPRRAGAKLLATQDGGFMGTIGGGAVEYTAQKRAMDTISSGKSFVESFSLTPGGPSDIGMICGGSVLAYFQYFSPGRAAELEALLDCANNCKPAWLITTFSDTCEWKAELAIGAVHPSPGLSSESAKFNNRPTLIKKDNGFSFVEPLAEKGKVYIFGGGHVARALVSLLARTGFGCTVLDDRPGFAVPEYFPDAERTVTCAMEGALSNITVTQHDFICVMTHGHNHDYAVLTQALRTEAGYIGVIGSRSKARAQASRLIADGFSEEDVKRIFSPIGLNIGAETPDEIAVSICAEMIAVRAGKRMESKW